MRTLTNILLVIAIGFAFYAATDPDIAVWVRNNALDSLRGIRV